MPLNEGQTKAIDELKVKKQAYLDAFSGEKGAAVLADLEKVCFIRRTTYDDNQNRVIFNEGQRSVVLHIQNMMRLDVEKTRNLMEKQNEQEKTNV